MSLLLHSGIECSLRNFAGDTRFCGVVNMLEGSDDIQRDLGRLLKWTSTNLMKFNRAKCKVLHMGWGNHKHGYKLCDELIEGSPERQA